MSDETGLALGSKSGADPSWSSETSDVSGSVSLCCRPVCGVFGYLCPVVRLGESSCRTAVFYSLSSHEGWVWGGGVAREVQRVTSPSHGGLAAAQHFGSSDSFVKLSQKFYYFLEKKKAKFSSPPRGRLERLFEKKVENNFERWITRLVRR